MNKIIKWLDVKPTSMTKISLKKQKIPRKKFADGLSLDIYKKYGWEPAKKNLSELQELQLRRDLVIKNGVDNGALTLLDGMSKQYEKKYLSDIL